MEQVLLNASKRDIGKGSSRAIRREGYVPAILYGKNVEAVSVKVPARDFSRVMMAGRNSIIKLAIAEKGGVDERTCMVKDIQQDPIRGDVIHADFHQINLKEKLRATVAVRIVGEDAVVKAGGVLQHLLWEVEVECLPTDIPDHLTADVSNVPIGGHLSVRDLKAPAGVDMVTDQDTAIASVLAPKAVEEEVKPADGVAPAETGQPEVISRGKQDEDGEAPGAKEAKGKAEKEK
ncbi:MAG: 50S ribosomal protein L25 [Bacillota bacterium]